MLGFKSFEVARYTLTGVELMHMIKKRPLGVEPEAEGPTEAEQFYALASSSPNRRSATHPKASTHEKWRQNPAHLPAWALREVYRSGPNTVIASALPP